MSLYNYCSKKNLECGFANQNGSCSISACIVIDGVLTDVAAPFKKIPLCIDCIICDEPVPLTENEEETLLYGGCVHSKICDKCKKVILRMREQLE
jgi:hypothetical protein